MLQRHGSQIVRALFSTGILGDSPADVLNETPGRFDIIQPGGHQLATRDLPVVELLLQPVQMGFHVGLQTEVRDEQASRIPVTDERQALAPPIDVDIRRRRGGSTYASNPMRMPAVSPTNAMPVCRSRKLTWCDACPGV